VLFERVCREHGITAKLTRPYSPTTTGKVERWHQTLRRELLDVAGPFADLPSAQAAITAWVHVVFSDRFKINILNELLFYVANMSMTSVVGGRLAGTHLNARL